MLEIALKLKIPKVKVEGATHFTATYIAKVIKSGALDSVYIPYFGSFQAKISQVGIIDKMRGRVPIIIRQAQEDNDDTI